MAVSLVGAGDGSSGVTVDDIQALQSQIDTLNTNTGTNTLDTDSDVERVGAQLQGGFLPAAAATLTWTGNGNRKRWIATSVYNDNTKRATWAAQAATTPYTLPVITSTHLPPAGVNGTAGYTFTHTATIDLGGGTPVWAIASGGTDSTHVAGLVLDPATGILSGTPSSAGTFLYVAQVTDELGGVATQVVTLSIAAAATPTFALPPTPPTQPAVGVAFSWNVAVYAKNFGTITSGFSSASLPNHHLSISTAGVISGTPLAADYGKSFNVTVQVTDGTTTKTASVQFSIPPQGTMAITTTTMPALQQSQAMTPAFIQTTGGVNPKTFAVTAGTLPTGLALQPSSATISGISGGTGSSTLTKAAHGLTEGQPVLSGANVLGLPQLAVYLAHVLTSSTFTLVSSVDGTTFTPTGSDTNAQVATMAGSVWGTPSASGAYDFTVTATDSTPTTPLTDDQEYTGTIALAAAAFSWFGGAASFDLTATAGNPKVGDNVDIDLNQFALNPGAAVTMDSGAVPTTPAGGFDINQPSTNHYGGKANKATTLNPVLRASNDGGSTWKSTQCHLTVISTTPGVAIDSIITNAGGTLGDSITKAQGKTNLAAIISAIAQASSAGQRLKSVAGTEGTPLLIGISRDSWVNAPYIQSGSSTTAGVSWWDLSNVLFYLVDGQPGSTSPSLIIQIQNVSNGVFNINLDVRGGRHTQPSGVGASGFYNDGIKLFQCDHESGVLACYNGVGLVGATTGGTSETFDIWLGQSSGGADIEAIVKGQWEGDTGTHYCSGYVTQDMLATDPNNLPARSWAKVTADKRRHGWGCHRAAIVGMRGGSDITDTERAVGAEAGTAPNTTLEAKTLPTYDVQIGESGKTFRTANNTRGHGLGVSANGNYGNPVHTMHVIGHHSVGDGAPTSITQKGADALRLTNDVVDTPVGSDIYAASCVAADGSAGITAAAKLAKVTVDGTSTAHGLGTHTHVSPNVAIAAGDWTNV